MQSKELRTTKNQLKQIENLPHNAIFDQLKLSNFHAFLIIYQDLIKRFYLNFASFIPILD